MEIAKLLNISTVEEEKKKQNRYSGCTFLSLTLECHCPWVLCRNYLNGLPAPDTVQ
uniref:Uncharacterized protein n=1 Tax=Anguilla anguilla TaxID=7936 RepID=A0A0E9X1Z5_ANGAN